MPERTWSTGEVAAEVGESEPVISRLLRFGKLPKPRRKISGKYRWTAEEVARAENYVALWRKREVTV